MQTWNVGVERTFGYSEEEFLNLQSKHIFTAEDIEKGAAEHEIQTAIREGRAEDERWHVRKDGSRFYGSGVMVALRDPQGELAGLGKIVRDYTALKDLLDRTARRDVQL